MSASPPTPRARRNRPHRASRDRTPSVRRGSRAGCGSCASSRAACSSHARVSISGSSISPGRARTRPPPRPASPSGSRTDARAPRRGGEQRRRFSPGRHRLDHPRGKPRSSITAAIGSETFIGSAPTPGVRDGLAQAAARRCGPLTPRASASSRIRSARGSKGRGRCSNPGALPRRRGSNARRGDGRRVAACRDGRLRLLEHQRALLGGARTTGPQQRIRPRPPLERARVGGQRHPGGALVGIIPCSAIVTSKEVEEDTAAPRWARARWRRWKCQ